MALNFRKVTDELIEKVSLADIAQAIGCSTATVDQARLSETAKARRSPPPGWEKAARKLAEAQAAHFTKLASRLRAAEGG